MTVPLSLLDRLQTALRANGDHVLLPRRDVEDAVRELQEKPLLWGHVHDPRKISGGSIMATTIAEVYNVATPSEEA